MQLFKFNIIIFNMLILTSVAQEQLESRGFMENINEGIRYAGQMLGINTASDVANLVARAFSTNNRKPNITPPSSNYEQYDNEPEPEQSKDQDTRSPHKPAFNMSDLMTNMLRLIGFDVNKLGALALNAIVMIAQAISNSFTQPSLANNGPHYAEQQSEGRALRSGTPLDWYLAEPTSNMRQLLDNALDANLTERLVNTVTKLEKGSDEGGCLKMLVCRSTPFIWGMQRTLQQRIETRNQTTPTSSTSSTDGLYTHMPTLEEYRKHAKICNQKYGKSCQLNEKY